MEMMDTLVVLKGGLFFLVLLYAAVHDARTKIIPDKVHVLLILISLLGWTWDSLWGLILVPLPFLIVAVAVKDSLGGGDVKLMAGIGSVLGVIGGLSAGILGLSVAILVNLLKGKRRESFALGPYLAAGAMIMFVFA
ncbi:leader peptidase (prepilin peptidase) / N-methyltransferase [Desulfitobacterium chlororespirans DSM 11544]|uniref:Leader peptidase (Prepilin peptidase) / N-methyltransferase n=2 Tax=Desulfitobacterium chlororespirans TaxID=51616 RepID=A0A1M7UY80_9FIRM|nr:leader peptidase (prepilin peptidase) / N-methyltransferase [Desulfitobacterium chlororespirans DSM 11544]